MENIQLRLENGPVLVADGAMGTMLQDAGLPIGGAPEAWLLENPEAVQGVHQAYLDAGADLILSCTFGGTRARLKQARLADRVAEVNRRAVEIARAAVAAAGRAAYVGGDIGPLGEFLAPLGTLTYEQAVEIFAEQASALVEAGVDVLYIETMADLTEALAALAGAQQAAQQAPAGREHIPIFVTMSFDSHGRTNMGVRPEDAAEQLQARGATAFGANCGLTLEMTEDAVAKMHETAPRAYLIAKPNAGLPHMVGDEVIYDATAADMAAYARRFVELGARVVGGCCGSTPAHIQAIAAAVGR